jgi:hypothetical protein
LPAGGLEDDSKSIVHVSTTSLKSQSSAGGYSCF